MGFQKFFDSLRRPHSNFVEAHNTKPTLLHHIVWGGREKSVLLLTGWLIDSTVVRY